MVQINADNVRFAVEVENFKKNPNQKLRHPLVEKFQLQPPTLAIVQQKTWSRPQYTKLLRSGALFLSYTKTIFADFLCWSRTFDQLWRRDVSICQHTCNHNPMFIRFSCYSCCQASVLLTSMVRILFCCRHRPTRCDP